MGIRDKDGSKLNSFDASYNDKIKEPSYSKDKDSELRKALENHEERENALVRANRKLEEQISELENKIFSIEDEYKTKLNEKEIELKVSRSKSREEYQKQISDLKSEISQLKIINSELNSKNDFYKEERRRLEEGVNEHENQLIETLR